ncbi:GNAT family N-acetyltransferase [Microbacterium sp.]|uniref:GNAT family N-acetyltransferase n=1 Tax=Microbacterium sp. TaxID=51671 RepID=UPI003F9A55DB
MTDFVPQGCDRIRLVEPGDAATLARLLQNNRDFLAPWEPLRSSSYVTTAGQLDDIDSALDRHRHGQAMPFVILDDAGAVAGRLTLSGIVKGPFQSCSMGYWLAEERTGQGLATQAVAAAIDHAFTEVGLHRVEAATLLSNETSQRVLARNGFEKYGLAPRYLKIAGSWQDHLMFQRLREDS